MVQMGAIKVMVLSICVLLAIGAHVREAQARPAPEQVAAMAEALKMLQQLDRHYAQIAKPRFGRSLNPHPYRDMADSDSSLYNQQEASDEYRR